ncbi:MAG: hypothetical protein NVS3B10_14000 [Polyangiales bacterium]
MDRRWLPAVLIGGGALVLVLAAVLLSERERPVTDPSESTAATAPGPPDPAPPGRPDGPEDGAAHFESSLAAPDAGFDAGFDTGKAVAPTPLATVTEVPAPTDAAAEVAVDAAREVGSAIDAADDPSGGSGQKPADVAARVRAQIAKVESDIVALEAAGKHAEAEQRRRVLQRLQAQLDVIDGGV